MRAVQKCRLVTQSGNEEVEAGESHGHGAHRTVRAKEQHQVLKYLGQRLPNDGPSQKKQTRWGRVLVPGTEVISPSFHTWHLIDSDSCQPYHSCRGFPSLSFFYQLTKTEGRYISLLLTEHWVSFCAAHVETIMLAPSQFKPSLLRAAGQYPTTLQRSALASLLLSSTPAWGRVGPSLGWEELRLTCRRALLEAA